jgi:hypothetical protein
MAVGIKWVSYYLSFARNGYSALFLVTEFADRAIQCGAEDDIAIYIGNSEECPLPGETVYEEGVGIEGIFAS